MSSGHSVGMFRRIVVKLSGEALTGPEHHGLHAPTVARIAADLVSAVEGGVEIAVVVGGGNFFRGIQGATKGIERARADSIGMLATVMNALALEAAIEAEGFSARALSAVPMPSVCQPYSRQAALHHLAKGRICVLAGGTGNPVLHDRHRCRPAGCRTVLRCRHEGHPSRRRLFSRSKARPGGGSFRTAYP